MLEYLLADAIARGADTIVGGGAAQSNYCRQLAAACARLGLRCVLVLRTVRGDVDLDVQGNLFLDVLAGAEVSVHHVNGRDQAALVDEAAERVRATGARPYVLEHHASLGAMAYVQCGLELHRQLAQAGRTPAAVYQAAAGETQAGLLLAQRLLGTSLPIVGFDPGVDWWDVRERIVRCANECAERLGLDVGLDDADVTNTSEMAGPGYGHATAAAVQAIRLVAGLEGVFLDPVYTGKAMAGLLDHADRGNLPREGPVVFLHTGGAPALFHYRDQFSEGRVPAGSPTKASV